MRGRSVRALGRIRASDVVIAVLGVVSGSAISGSLAGWSVFAAAAFGAVVALAARVVADRLTLPMAEWLALSIAAALALGVVVTGPVPTPAAFGDVFRGLVDGWADLLSSVPPVEATGYFRMLPYVLAWLGASVGFALSRTIRFPAVGAIGPFAAFSLGLLFGTEIRTRSLVQGALLVGGALVLGFVQQRAMGIELDEELGNTTRLRRRTRTLGAAGVLLAVAVAAPLATPLVPGFDERERFDLRDRLEPPWNPLDEPSPLASIKGNYLDAKRDEVVFTASGPTIPRRWTLATLADYNGTVWTVGDASVDGLAPFVPVEDRVPTVLPNGSAQPVTVVVEIDVLDVPWLPVPGRPIGIDAGDADVRFNRLTGTLAAPASSLRTYEVTAVPWTALSDQQLRSATLVTIDESGLGSASSSVERVSNEFVEGADPGWGTIDAIQDELLNGFYLADETARPGHSWIRLDEFFAGDVLFGNEEQYAAAAAIVARTAGISARVVVGFEVGEVPDSTAVVTRLDATAWLEVETVEFGWVPVPVTPPRDREPSLADSGVRVEEVAAPNPPPPPPPPPDAEVQQEEEELDADEEASDANEDARSVPLAAVIAGGAVGGPLALAAGWLGLMTVAKSRRRTKRRRANEPTERVAGAWAEAVDRLSEAGLRTKGQASVRSQASAFEGGHDLGGNMTALAVLTEQSIFGPKSADEAHAETAWTTTQDVSESLRREAGWFERMKRRANPTPLIRRGIA